MTIKNKDVICPICGNPICNTKIKKKGRPRQYHDECRQVLNAITLLDKKLGHYKKLKPTKTGKAGIRRTLMSTINANLN